MPIIEELYDHENKPDHARSAAASIPSSAGRISAAVTPSSDGVSSVFFSPKINIPYGSARMAHAHNASFLPPLLTVTSNEFSIIIDSGTMSHMTPDEKLFL